MISSLRGTVVSITGSTVVIEVQGVGYAVALTPRHAARLVPGEETLVLTALIVREDALSLYGFAEPEERAIFDLLTGVSGVGPKSALGVLAELTPDRIAAAVAAEDDAAFRKVSGIGPKTAKLIVVQLAGKLDAVVIPPARDEDARGDASSRVAADVVEALTGLGWPERTARTAVDEVVSTADDSVVASVPVLLRAVLTHLGPTGRAMSGAAR